MSALSMATLGAICDDRAISMATLGVICGTAPEPVTPPGGGGSSGARGRNYKKRHENALEKARRERILQEDQDVIALIMTMITKGLM